MFIPIDRIHVGSRIRQDKGKDWDAFLKSFGMHGQLQPIKVEAPTEEGGMYNLIAGGRRYMAIKHYHDNNIPIPHLEHGMIEASERDAVKLHTKLLMEFAENNERADFTFVEKAKFIRKFHEAMRLEYGEEWTQEVTARTLNLSTASISHYLRIEEAVKTDPTIAKAGTLDAAVKRMKVQERLKQRHDDVKSHDSDNNNAFARATAILHHGDAREWFSSIEDESVDLVNFDPPWGDNASHKSAENHEEFDDSTEYADSLMDALFPHIFRTLKADRFCVFWHRMWASEQMAALAIKHGFNLQFTRTPCIWYKPDRVADQNRDPERKLIDAYEPFFLLRKGNPIFHERYTHNVFAFDRVPLGSITHPTEKPLDLMAAIIKLTTVPGETVLDPTAGSSATLDAALRALRKARGCELSERYYERGIGRIGSYLKTFTEK